MIWLFEHAQPALVLASGQQHSVVDEVARHCRRRGAGVEPAVLSRAVAWHSGDRVVRHQNHTIVLA